LKEGVSSLSQNCAFRRGLVKMTKEDIWINLGIGLVSGIVAGLILDLELQSIIGGKITHKIG
jgi:hypothetical protein